VRKDGRKPAITLHTLDIQKNTKNNPAAEPRNRNTTRPRLLLKQGQNNAKL